MRRAAALLAALWLAAAPALAEPPPDDEYEVGIRELDQGEWARALPIYRKITRENPAYPWGWLGLGWSLHYTGEPRAAIPAYRRAIELGAQAPHRMWLEIARCYAALGVPDSAYAALENALANGLTNLARLGTDSRFDPIRREPRFRDLLGLPDSTQTDRVSGWRRDLRLLAREIERMHAAPFRRISREDLAAAVTAISDSVAALDDDALAVRVMRLVCRLGDGHTWADPPYLLTRSAPALPLLFGQFEEGLFVTATAPEQEALLWARVETIEGRPAAAVLAALDPVVAKDNSMRVLSVGPQRLRYPRLLRSLGLARRSDRLELKVRDRDGRPRTVTLSASAAPLEWRRAPSGAALPAYAAERERHYGFRLLPDSTTLYFQYNACADQEGESVADFAGRLLRFIDERDVRRLVVDLRWNGGGNLFLNRPLLEAIVQSRKVNQPGKLFVIAGRHTFSAAMSFAAQLERFAHPIFAGEPTGSSPNFVGETNFVTLPHSGIRVSLSNLAWQNSIAQDHRVWIAPRLPVPWTFEGYRSGRDPVLEAILRYGS